MLKFPFYPCLLAIYLPLHFYLSNKTIFSFVDAAIGIGFLFLSSIVLLLVVAGIYGAVSKAAVLVCYIVLGFGVFYFPVGGVYIYFGGAAILGYVLTRFVPHDFFSTLLNVFSVVLLGMLMASQLPVRNPSSTSEPGEGAEFNSEFDQIGSSDLIEKPSIIHIVLDGYSSSRSLKEYYDYDNGGFEDELKRMGFVVFDRPVSPYNQTLLSMSSLFLGRYWEEKELDDLGDGDEGKRLMLGRRLLNSGAVAALARNGYNFKFLDSGYEYIHPMRGARVSKVEHAPAFFNEFTYHFLLNSVYRDHVRDADIIGPTARHAAIYEHAFSHDLYRDTLTPYFMYQHVLAPHPPFFHDDEQNVVASYRGFSTVHDGSHATFLNPQRIEQYKKGYLNKLKVTNKKLIKQLESIKFSIKGKYIIVVHGDHGGGAYYHQDGVDETCVAERFSPFFAIATNMDSFEYSLRLKKSGTFSIVNTYRFIFSSLTTIDFGALETRAWYVPWADMSAPKDVTVRLQRNCY